ncbi:MAG TPA: FMN-binding protein [Acholeplasmataceae bacterium]|nr:FMN-binding protein [Acholeplasmataceae bacterium]
MKKVLLPLGLAIFLILIFVLGVVAAENVAKNRQDTVKNILEQQAKEKEMQALNSAAEEFIEEFDKLELQEDKPLIISEEDGEHNKVLARYQIIKDDSTIGTLYYIEVKGRNAGLRLAIVIDPTTRNILGYKIIANNETPSYFGKLDDSFFNQFINVDITKPVFEFNNVATVTLSSNAMIRAMNLAREQFYQDLGEELPKPSVNFTYVSSIQLLPDYSMFHFVMTSETGTVNAQLKYDTSTKLFSYEDSDVVLSQPEIDALLGVANKNKPKALITDYNANTYEFTVTTTGFSGTITAYIKLDSNGNFVSYEVDPKHIESYDDIELNPLYRGPDPIKTIPGEIVDKNGTEGVMNVSHATVTSDALKRIANTLRQVWEANNQ